LYLQLSEIYKPEEKTKGEAGSSYLKSRKLLKLIDENFKDKKSPAEYADMMNMSIRHLNRICQEALNSSTGDLIFERIVLEAKRLLIHNDLTISQVAEQLGYEDYSYFIRIFRKKAGVSPKEFQLRMVKPFNNQ
jgi:AraC-like DNA-binding protein